MGGGCGSPVDGENCRFKVRLSCRAVMTERSFSGSRRHPADPSGGPSPSKVEFHSVRVWLHIWDVGMHSPTCTLITGFESKVDQLKITIIPLDHRIPHLGVPHCHRTNRTRHPVMLYHWWDERGKMQKTKMECNIRLRGERTVPGSCRK